MEQQIENAICCFIQFWTKYVSPIRATSHLLGWASSDDGTPDRIYVSMWYQITFGEYKLLFRKFFKRTS